MAAAEGSSFLDSTLSGFAEDPRLPPSLRADSTPVFASDRVVPLLLQDIVSSMQVRQRLHLRLLSEQLDDLIEYDDTTQEEFEMLLVMLFSFTHRRSGLTPLQKRHNIESSDLAFTILHALVGRLHTKHSLVMKALASVCSTLGCHLPNLSAAEDFGGINGGGGDHHADDNNLLPDEFSHVVDTVAGALPVAEAAIQARLRELESLKQSAVGVLMAASGSGGNHQKGSPKHQEKLFPHANMYAYSIDALAAQDRRGISEYDFTNAVGAFASLPKMESEDTEDPSAADRRNFSMYLSSGGFFGTKFISADQAGKVRHTVEGAVLLFDVIKFLFPLVPEGVLLKRIHGMLLVDVAAATEGGNGEAAPSSTGATPASSPRPSVSNHCLPPTLIEDIYQSPRLHFGQKLSAWLIAGEPKAQRGDAVQWMVRWFSDVDYCHSGLLPIDGLNALASVQNPWEEHVRSMALKRRKTRVSVYDVLNQVFPADAFEQLKEQFTLALRTTEKEYAAAAKYKQVSNTTYKLALVKFIELQEGGANPGGDNSTAMTAGEHVALAAFAEAQWKELSLYLEAVLRHAKATRHYEVLVARQAEAQKAQLEVLQQSRLALVEAVAGPEVPPPVCEIAGFRVNRTILELDGFLSDPGSKARAQLVLQSCDFAGIPAGFFLERASEAHLHLVAGRPSCASPGIVFRDFTFSSVRPPTGAHWSGDHKLLIRTNIKRGSDVKYRFSFEGYNFGINKAVATTVIGHASTSLTRVGALESFGWPDGWDRSAILHYSGGFERMHQRYDDDGYVVMDVEAHSFSKIGFGVSVWLCLPDHGRHFDVAVHVEHW